MTVLLTMLLALFSSSSRQRDMKRYIKKESVEYEEGKEAYNLIGGRALKDLNETTDKQGKA